MYEIKRGDELYLKTPNGEIKRVTVKEIFLEKYISGYKTIIRVIDENNFIITYFASDLESKLFTTRLNK